DTSPSPGASASPGGRLSGRWRYGRGGRPERGYFSRRAAMRDHGGARHHSRPPPRAPGTMVLPAGGTARAGEEPTGPRSAHRARPLATCHRYTVRSWLAEARVLPSGVKATSVTPRRCSLAANTSRPEAASQTLTLPSYSPAERSPAGENARLRTRLPA